MALSKEDLAELAALKAEVQQELDADANAAIARNLEALRMRKRLSSKDRKHGRDFAVIETKIGVFAIRKPVDTEIDTVVEKSDDRGAQENFALALMLEPAAEVVRPLMSKEPGLVHALAEVALELAKVTLADNAKK